MEKDKSHLFYKIYGDNIVECERAASLLLNAFNLTQDALIPEFSSAWSPKYSIKLGERKLLIQFLTDLKRHEFKPMDELKKKGAPLKEGIDAIITKKMEDHEKIILCIEWTSAIPAGNQAWQHCGRAWSMKEADIPLIEFNDIFGGELKTKTRTLKSVRKPSPVLIWAHLSLLQDSSGTVLSHWKPSPMAVWANSELYTSLDSNLPNLFELIRNMFLNEELPNIVDSAEAHLIAVLTRVNELTSSSKITNEQWMEIIEKDNPKARLERIKKQYLSWKPKTPTGKTAGISETWKNFIGELLRVKIPSLCIAPLQSDLPWAILPKENLEEFARLLNRLDRLNIESKRFIIGEDVIDWVSTINQDIAIAYMSGWKKGGGDPRPPRGLLPFVRMILGDDIPILTFMTGPGHRFDGNSPNLPVPEWDDVLSMEGRKRLSSSSGYWKPLFYCSQVIIFTHEQASLHNENFKRGIII